ncbi:hypothetical protein PVK06_008874 [Gossypium arboreum]|uniref:Uncharacterized protein n=1 Tax=Gossypium arboreum TaxID=29729 RepID=A0ABR0QL14_GOSAR|nr:hypothetical protein PVK06_008874 [Gossypium arboreum]
MVQETKVRISPPTLGSDNLELGTEALTRLVREVLEEVKEIGETLRARCVDCKKKRDRSSLARASFYEGRGSKDRMLVVGDSNEWIMENRVDESRNLKLGEL